ncbi:hypothetical protein TSAR_015600 [Trichomalopsis sarcophagae]|uniref:Uncharacterized protein n=1 Tax=Trichomalopsis sarcophagae TaxID=543379 RepID=A0A232ELS8_9HYME|nr:hypothetical protein TSAR_015600 [Trichomalopsis sarcophagae]
MAIDKSQVELAISHMHAITTLEKNDDEGINEDYNDNDDVKEGAGVEHPSRQHIVIHREFTRYNPFFRLSSREALITIRRPLQNADVIEWLGLAMHDLYRYVCEITTPDDFVGITINSDQCRKGVVWISYRLVRELSAVEISEIMLSVTQSNTDFEIDNKLFVNVNSVSVHRGPGQVSLISETTFK